MMTSFVENIPAIVTLVGSLKSKAILDIGPGFGKFGLLFREALLSMTAEKGDLLPHANFKIDCVESCEYFWNLPWHQSLYDRHFHQDLFSIDLSIISAYDLVVLIDVVEHGPKGVWLDWIRGIRAVGKPKILISTPKKVVFYQEHYYGKDCPLHQTQWNVSDFVGFNPKWIPSKDSHILLIGG
jgi:hypothetical protein